MQLAKRSREVNMQTRRRMRKTRRGCTRTHTHDTSNDATCDRQEPQTHHAALHAATTQPVFSGC